MDGLKALEEILGSKAAVINFLFEGFDRFEKPAPVSGVSGKSSGSWLFDFLHKALDGDNRKIWEYLRADQDEEFAVCVIAEALGADKALSFLEGAGEDPQGYAIQFLCAEYDVLADEHPPISACCD